MATDWRALFDSIGVGWTDRQARAGNISIPCPWCGDDPSEHLGIHLATGRYYCWRDSRHKGGDALYVLVKLGYSRTEATNLVSIHRTDKDESPAAVPDQNTVLNTRDPMEPRYLKYLESRGFSYPESAVRIGRLCASPLHRWRIFFPLSSLHGVEGWTGRALQDNEKPRYLTICPTANRCLAGSFHAHVLVLVEGPMDALKINCTQIPNLSAAAIIGKQLSLQRLSLLASIRPKHVLVCLDADAGHERALTMVEEIKQFTNARVLYLPDDYKDPGDMPISAIREWIGAELDAKETACLYS